MAIAVGSGVAVSLGVAVGAGAAVGVGADVGVAVGLGRTGVAVGNGVGVGLEQAATSAANANKIMRVDSFDMEAAKLLRLGAISTGVLDMKKSLAVAVGEAATLLMCAGNVRIPLLNSGPQLPSERILGIHTLGRHPHPWRCHPIGAASCSAVRPSPASLAHWRIMPPTPDNRGRRQSTRFGCLLPLFP